MVGGIIIVVVLVIAFPVAVMMGMGAVAAALAVTTNRASNSAHVGTELYDVARADPYA